MVGFAHHQLLDHERRAEEQVPLLLQMKEDKVALVKAIDSGDTDLGELLPVRRMVANPQSTMSCCT